MSVVSRDHIALPTLRRSTSETLEPDIWTRWAMLASPLAPMGQPRFPRRIPPNHSGRRRIRPPYLTTDQPHHYPPKQASSSSGLALLESLRSMNYCHNHRTLMSSSSRLGRPVPPPRVETVDIWSPWCTSNDQASSPGSSATTTTSQT